MSLCLVQQEIRALLVRHKITQVELASLLGVNRVSLSNVLKGRRQPPPKLLRALGFERLTVYVKSSKGIDIIDAPVKPPSGISKAAERELPQAPSHRAESADSPLGLTTDRIKVAVRYKLNPGASWKEFIETAHPGELARLDASWLSWCKTHGTEPTPRTTASKPLYAGLGDGAAVLVKPVHRGPDHRRPKAFGEKPTLMPVIVPQAVSHE